MSNATSGASVNYRADIDGLRSVAVISVLLYHLGIKEVSGGFVGVDVFFVISGYLITRNIVDDFDKRQFSFRKFYLARVRRIIPALIATVALTFIAGALILAPGVFQELGRASIASLFSVSNILFWSTSGYFDAESVLKPLLHTWSLGVEEQFYLFWPALLAIAFRLGKSGAGAAVALALIVSLTSAQLNLERDPAGTFFLLPFRVWELAIGGALVWAPPLLPRAKLFDDAGLFTGLALIIAAAILYDRESPFPGLLALAPCGGAAIAIYFGRAPVVSRLLTNRVSVGIGKISYSLYLVHWPLIVLTKYVLMREFFAQEKAIMFVLCIALAYLMYLYVEQPFRRRAIGGFVIKPRALLATMAISAAIVTAPALSAWSRDGWAWRLGTKAELVNGIPDPRRFHSKYFGGSGCPLPRCETTPGARRKVYVIGDSHARALYAGLAKTFPDTNFIIYGPDSCPLYTIKFGLHRDAYSTSCQEARRLAFAEISAADAPVIMMHHWSTRLHSKHYNITEKKNKPIKFRNADRFAKFVIHEMPSVQSLIGSQPLIVIGGVPRYSAPASPLDCISRPLQEVACEWSDMSKETISEQEGITKALVAANQRRFIILDPYSYLCVESKCRNFDAAERPLYSDMSHLSVWGSEFLIGKMRRDLDRALWRIRRNEI